LSGLADSYGLGGGVYLCAAGGVSQPDAAALAREKSASVYLSIISQQTFIGCWKLNTELSQLLDISLDQLQNSAPVKVSYVYRAKNTHL